MRDGGTFSSIDVPWGMRQLGLAYSDSFEAVFAAAQAFKAASLAASLRIR